MQYQKYQRSPKITISPAGCPRAREARRRLHHTSVLNLLATITSPLSVLASLLSIKLWQCFFSNFNSRCKKI